jgi:NADPH2:quinone reductase
VNPVDWKIRKGFLKDMMPHHFPLIPGWDASGTIESMGKSVSDFKVGDKVYAYCRKPEVQWGTYAEFITVDAKNVAIAPTNISSAQAASIPLVGLTAWQALFDWCKLKKGQTILIHAGAGGVGSLAIQFAASVGAEVITTVSEKKESYVRELGAKHVIDYRKNDFETVVNEKYPTGVDAVCDLVGGEAQTKSFNVLRQGGSLVSIVNPPEESLAREKSINAGFVFVEPSGAQLTEIKQLIEASRVLPPRLQEFSLEDAPKAQALSEKGGVVGKLIIKIY